MSRDPKIHMTPEQLKDFMLRHRFDRDDLADLLGVKPLAVHHWLHGRRAISLTTARLIRFFDKYPQTMDYFG